MPFLFGKKWTRNQIQKYTGAPWQLGSVRHMRFAGGTEDGTELVQFETGSGLTFNVLPSRGLDIASAKFQGAPLAMEMPTGEAHPSFFEPHGIEWLRTFFVGLVTTCGLTWAGAPCEDEGQDLCLHGRYTHLPARNLKITDEWIDNERVLSVSGDLREAYLYGPNIAATRTITTVVGGNTIMIEDTVRNEGFSKTPHQMLYHINIGFPIVSETAQLLANSTAAPRDPVAEKGLDQCRSFEAPTANYKEQVFYHDIKKDRQGYAHVAIVNPDFNKGQGLGIYLRYRQNELPRFAQWKNVLSGAYVCGLEPANCSVQGRAHDREDSSLIFLNPGEEKNYSLELTVLPDNEAIKEVMKIIGGKKK